MNRMNQRDAMLLSKYDRDPGPWRPVLYSVAVDIPVDANQVVEASINLNNEPYVLERMTYSGVGLMDTTSDLSQSGHRDDGQFFFEWKDEQTNYQNIAGIAVTMFGTKDHWLPLPQRIAYPGNRTVTFRLQSTYTRVLDPVSDTFKVMITMHGKAYLGELEG